jgi:transcriptional regulator with XRE-family HTH domain
VAAIVLNKTAVGTREVKGDTEDRVTPSSSPNSQTSNQADPPDDRTARAGVVAGAVLRGARLSAGISEARLAAASGVTEDTVRSWEDGSSPLASLPLPRFEELEEVLMDARADQRIVADLATAAWCDLVIVAITGHEDASCLTADPVTSEDAFGELLTWSLAGRVPARYVPYAAVGPLLADSALVERVIQALDEMDAWPAAARRAAT